MQEPDATQAGKRSPERMEQPAKYQQLSAKILLRSAKISVTMCKNYADIPKIALLKIAVLVPLHLKGENGSSAAQATKQTQEPDAIPPGKSLPGRMEQPTKHHKLSANILLPSAKFSVTVRKNSVTEGKYF